jgi:hypothetical protein
MITLIKSRYYFTLCLQLLILGFIAMGSIGGCNNGGGGGGGHGNTNGLSIAGAGGGSMSIQSTKSSNLSPASKQDNPCPSGCVRITFAP